MQSNLEHPELKIHRRLSGLRLALPIVLSVTAMVVAYRVPQLRLLGPLGLGALVGTLFARFPQLLVGGTPLKPLGLGWKIAWAVCVLLAIAGFISPLFGWGSIAGGLLFTMVSIWGFLIQRYRTKAWLAGNATQPPRL